VPLSRNHQPVQLSVLPSSHKIPNLKLRSSRHPSDLNHARAPRRDKVLLSSRHSQTPVSQMFIEACHMLSVEPSIPASNVVEVGCSLDVQLVLHVDANQACDGRHCVRDDTDLNITSSFVTSKIHHYNRILDNTTPKSRSKTSLTTFYHNYITTPTATWWESTHDHARASRRYVASTNLHSVASALRPDSRLKSCEDKLREFRSYSTATLGDHPRSLCLSQAPSQMI
jgi:hypothetical protein